MAHARDKSDDASRPAILDPEVPLSPERDTEYREQDAAEATEPILIEPDQTDDVAMEPEPGTAVDEARSWKPAGGQPMPMDDVPDPSQTDWSMIRRAVHDGKQEPSEAWDQLVRRYWPAIYAYVRSSGLDVHEAADLTQGFVCDVMLGRRLVEVADPERGRFRTLLLTAIKNYLAERHRYETRQKRSPVGRDGSGKRVLELDRNEMSDFAVSTGQSPETAFVSQWSRTLVRRVLERVREECQAEELSAHWCVFEARVVRPMLFGAEPTSYAALVERLDLKDAGQAANMMITVKRRFARALYAEVARTVSEDVETGEELHDLLRSLERGS